MKTLGSGIDTHYFNNPPDYLVQIMVSRCLMTSDSRLRTIPKSVEIARFLEMVDYRDYPKPIPYGRKNGINPDGFSDHFPIFVSLSES